MKTIVEQYGNLQVLLKNGKRRLCSQSGEPVQLKGMSTMGLQWQNWVLNEGAFETLVNEWGCKIIRLAMYVQEGGYAITPAEKLADVEKGIELCKKFGIYALVDWHTLTPGDPTDTAYTEAGINLPQYAEIRKAHPDWGGAELFFAYLSQKYGNLPNLLFETANEPNKLPSGSWETVLKPYHEKIVKAIRVYDADTIPNVVICGTETWSQDVDAVLEKPLDDEQTMYTMHFYAGTHGQDLRDKTQKALDAGVPVFCTEWGTTEADGGRNMKVYPVESDTWLQFLDQNGISWCNWSMTRGREGSAAFAEAAPLNGRWKDSDLSESGLYVRAKIKS